MFNLWTLLKFNFNFLIPSNLMELKKQNSSKTRGKIIYIYFLNKYAKIPINNTFKI